MLEGLDTVLEVDSVSKLYSRKQTDTRRRLGKAFLRTVFRLPLSQPDSLIGAEFWSLRDVSFQLKRGEALGVIGANGAGKTTLLRLLSGQLLPDSGEIRILGNASAMIDLTAGFQMGATGSRNIYLRGAMLGRSREEIEGTYTEIVDFAELGDAIDAPVSTYSSGMLMRLAFSIMISMKPDVLFIDEILSVGDFYFQQKCLAKIREMRENTSFVLVSHSMGSIKLFCDKAIVLNKGKIEFQGKPEEAVLLYEKMRFGDKEKAENLNKSIQQPFISNSELVTEVEHYWSDSNGVQIREAVSGETIFFVVIFKMSYQPRNLVMGVPVWTEEGSYVTGFSTELQDTVIEIESGELVKVVLTIPAVSLNPGTYVSNFSMNDGVEFLYRAANQPLKILPNGKRYWGVVTLSHKWEKSVG